MSNLWLRMVIIATAITAGFASYVITRNPDNVVEQAAEAVLRSQGVDIDLSPSYDKEEA